MVQTEVTDEAGDEVSKVSVAVRVRVIMIAKDECIAEGVQAQTRREEEERGAGVFCDVDEVGGGVEGCEGVGLKLGGVVVVGVAEGGLGCAYVEGAEGEELVGEVGSGEGEGYQVVGEEGGGGGCCERFGCGGCEVVEELEVEEVGGGVVLGEVLVAVDYCRF